MSGAQLKKRDGARRIHRLPRTRQPVRSIDRATGVTDTLSATHRTSPRAQRLVPSPWSVFFQSLTVLSKDPLVALGRSAEGRGFEPQGRGFEPTFEPTSGCEPQGRGFEPSGFEPQGRGSEPTPSWVRTPRSWVRTPHVTHALIIFLFLHSPGWRIEPAGGHRASRGCC